MVSVTHHTNTHTHTHDIHTHTHRLLCETLPYSREDVNKCLLTPDREATTDQGQITPNWIWWTNMSYWNMFYRNLDEGLLTGVRNVSKCLLHHQNLPQHEWQVMKAGNLEPSTQPADNSTGWQVFFPGRSVGLVWVSLRNLGETGTL